jgi:single-strand DNA-binding protein
MNLAILTGHLGRDPELRQVGSDNVLGFAVAVEVGTKAKPETMWVECALWGKRALSLQPILSKGMRVTISGAIKMEEYKAKDGTNRTKLKIHVDQLDLPPRNEAPAKTVDEHNQAKANGYQPQPTDNGGEDIPF